MSFLRKIAKPVYHKAQDNSMGKRSITLAFLLRRLTRRFGSKEKASSYLAKNMHRFYITGTKFNKGTQIKNLFSNSLIIYLSVSSTDFVITKEIR